MKEHRNAVFKELHKGLEVHARIEDEVSYPALKEQLGADEEVDDGREEHDQIRARLATMQEQPAGSAPWLSALEGLTLLIDHHVRDEEEKVFSLAARHLEDDVLPELGERMHHRKEQLMAEM